MKNKYYLVEISRNETKHKFIMLNAYEPLKNRQCNPRLFNTETEAKLNISVIEYFGCALTILNGGKPLDRRTRNYKELINTHRYFSASYLPYFDNLNR